MVECRHGPRRVTRQPGAPIRMIAATQARTSPSPSWLAAAGAWSEKLSTIATTDRANQHNSPA